MRLRNRKPSFEHPTNLFLTRCREVRRWIRTGLLAPWHFHSISSKSHVSARFSPFSQPPRAGIGVVRRAGANRAPDLFGDGSFLLPQWLRLRQLQQPPVEIEIPPSQADDSAHAHAGSGDSKPMPKWFGGQRRGRRHFPISGVSPGSSQSPSEL
jgi:hypothetical protein